MGELDGRVVLVVGGAGGTGDAVVDDLVGDGASVEILDEDTEAARDVVRRHGGPLGRVSHRSLAPDACAETLRRAVTRVVADRGLLDGIVTVGRTEDEVLAVLKAARAPLRASPRAAVVLVGDGTDQTAALARWLANDGVRVNSVSPAQGASDTAHAVRFLLSDAAEQISGLRWPSADRTAALPRRPGHLTG
jgi:NAD(P)-dependent dehydrogenase (short-subunit alcohol dehydrogenase family)